MNSATRIGLIVNKVSLGGQQNDTSYWRTQSYQDRLAALEQIRQEYHRWKYGDEPRLQRVYKSLNDNQARYLVIGGYAVAFHGYPR
jgi:hypothetical protein